jgi:hypothetical protein
MIAVLLTPIASIARHDASSTIVAAERWLAAGASAPFS